MNIYKTIFTIGLAFVSLTAAAQKDSTIIRQVLLEREYNPTLQDASKINTLPSIYTPVVKAKDFKYVSSAPQLTLNNNRLGSAEPGDIKTDVVFSKKRGYFVIGGGSHANVEGALGYRILDSDNDRLDITAAHSSTSGNVDYLDGDKYFYKDAKAKYAASQVKLKYQHSFEPSILSFDASFLNNSFNYYGNTFVPKESPVFPYDITTRQNVDVINIGAGLRSSENNDGLLKYKGSVRYQNFKSKYGLYTDNKGPKGGQFDIDVDFYTDFASDKVIGIKGGIMNQSFGSKNETFHKDAFHSFTNITASPYFNMEGGNWDVSLGLNINSLFDIKTKFLVSPNIKAQARVNEENTFYVEATGGVNNNTFLDVLQENRYATPLTRIEYSKTLYDAKIGFKSGEITGFEFDLFAGYKKTDKDHLFAASPLYIPVVAGDPDPDYTAWGNVGTPVYANIGTGHIGGLVKTTLIPYTDLSAKLTAYFYNVKYTNGYIDGLFDTALLSEKKAWGRPTFTAEFNADVRPFDKLILSVNYLFAAGRKALAADYGVLNYRIAKMNDINELNFKGEYEIADWVSVNARVNNILFQKYELQYGYALQGFNFMAGLSFKF